MLTARIAPSYRIRLIVMALACVVFGVWGIYDYTVAIPNQELRFEQSQVFKAVNDALGRTPEDPDYGAKRAAAVELVNASFQALAGRLIEDAGDPSGGATSDQAKPIAASEQDSAWFVALKTFQDALSPEVATNAEVVVNARALADRGNTDLEGVTKPAAYDRPVQWMFILCLPFAPWYLWKYVQASKRSYELDDDGTLTMPEGRWTRDEIEDIDMSRWMKKSIATVRNTDGADVKLDAYVYKNLHLIIGAIANRFHPDAWTEEGKAVKSDENPPDADENADSGQDADAPANADEPPSPPSS